MAPPLTVAAIVVNWNSGDLLRQAVESLARQRRRPDHLIVVDNASRDDSLLRAAQLLGNAQVIRLDRNVGFAAANNLAAQEARRFDLLALLNPDAVAEPEWLEALVAASEREPDVASFASQMLWTAAPEMLDGAGDSYHVSGRAWRNGYRTPRARWPAADEEVFAPCAAAALYRREAFADAGGFDERYFCYFEDVDLGFRLRLRGHRSRYVHAAIVRHAGSALVGERSDFAVYHGQRNLVWTYVKDMPTPLLWAYLPQHVAVNIAAWLFYAKRGQSGVVLKAKVDALRGLRSVLRERKAVQAGRRATVSNLRAAMNRSIAKPYVNTYDRSH